ncbi:toxic anion resistance protein [Henriciella sp. AS95]|uniref:toxic anion resistance protein n=1 Tax=Henriciella sp. AS95 TaxID=3135782 RepID=UPI0031792183
MTKMTATHSQAITEADDIEARRLADAIDVNSTTSIAAFGRQFDALNATYADEMIKSLSDQNSEELRERLASVVRAAKSFEVSPAPSRLSQVPVIGRLASGLRSGRDRLFARFTTLEKQIDQVLASIDGAFDRLAHQCNSLEEMYDGVRDEQRMLGIYKRACEIRLEAIHAEDSTAPSTVEEERDRELIRNALEKRVADLAVLKQSAVQTLPMIRLMSANTSALIDKFHNIKTLTVPSWKRSFAMALSLREQQSAVELAETIDDATNHFLKKNAELLRDNTIATVKSNQRLAIDIETLEHVHETIVSTFEDAQACFAESRKSRLQVLEKLNSMNDDMSHQTTLSVGTSSNS